MLDRKNMLSLAAKAGGYTLSWAYDDSCCFIEGKDEPWVPLNSYGDAMRLAQMLEMTVDFRKNLLVFEHPAEGTVEMFVGFEEDSMLYCITQAAAEIGEQM